MAIRGFKSICSVMGCKNVDTLLISRNGVTINTPNICKECLKLAYETAFEDQIKAELEKVEKEKKEAVEKALSKNDSVSCKNEAFEDEESEEASKKKTRKRD